MKALLYLTLTQLKNRIKEAFSSPKKIVFSILIILFFAVFIFSMIMATVTGEMPEGDNPADMIFAIAEGLYLLVFLLSVYQGMSSGGAMFTLQDTYHIFMSPIRPNTALFYGLIKQLGMAVLAGVYIAFQVPNIAMSFDISGITITAMVIGYMAVGFCGTVTGMLVYLLTCRSDRARSIAKAIFRIVCVIYLGVAVINILPQLSGGFNIGIIINYLLSFPALIFPVSGWLTAGAMGIEAGNALLILLGIGGTIVYLAVLSILAAKVDGDYYEDVISTAERTFAAVSAAKENRVVETPKNVKLGTTGIGKGDGATAIYHKLMLENRRGKTLFISTSQIIFLVMTLLIGFALVKARPDDIELDEIAEANNIAMLLMVFFGAYIQIFSIGTSRWARELLHPYIYMIPDDPFKKMLCCIAESLTPMLTESVIFGIAAAVILGANPIYVLPLMLIRFSFFALYTGFNLALERFLGFVQSKTIKLTIYIFGGMIIMVPSLLIIIFTGIVLPPAAAFAIGGAVNIGIALLFILISKDMLEHAEVN